MKDKKTNTMLIIGAIIFAIAIVIITIVMQPNKIDDKSANSSGTSDTESTDTTKDLEDIEDDAEQVEENTEESEKSKDDDMPSALFDEDPFIETAEEPSMDIVREKRPIYAYMKEMNQDSDLLYLSDSSYSESFKELIMNMNYPEFYKNFNTSDYPETWSFCALDVLKYGSGRTEYWYWYEDTNVRCMAWKDTYTGDWQFLDTSVYYGSDYTPIHFTNGVPSNVEHISDVVSQSNISSAYLETDYKEGDSTITFKDAKDETIVYPDIAL